MEEIRQCGKCGALMPVSQMHSGICVGCVPWSHDPAPPAPPADDGFEAWLNIWDTALHRTAIPQPPITDRERAFARAAWAASRVHAGMEAVDVCRAERNGYIGVEMTGIVVCDRLATAICERLGVKESTHEQSPATT